MAPIKKGIAVSTPGAGFAALAIKESLRESIGKVAGLGYDAVELHLRDPRTVDREEIAALLDRYRLTCPTIGTGQAYGDEGLSFADPDPLIRRRAVSRIRQQIDLAAALSVPMVTIGLIRGTVAPGGERKRAEDHLRECLARCLDHDRAVTLIVEPLNRYETTLLNDAASVRALIDELGRPNLKLLIDSFHMNIEEPDIVATILASGEYIAHVHFADSNRWAPGCGHIDFGAILRALEEIGYRGTITAEILPLPTPEESARLAVDYFRKLGL